MIALLHAALVMLAVGHYCLRAWTDLHVVTTQHLAMFAVALGCGIWARIATRRSAAGGRTTSSDDDLQISQPSSAKLAAKTPALMTLMTALVLPALLVWHLLAAYWSALYGARALPAAYRLTLVAALLLSLGRFLAMCISAAAPERRGTGPKLAVASSLVMLFLVEVASSAIAPPLPGPWKFSRDGQPITIPVNEAARGYPYAYRPHAAYREEWADDPDAYLDAGHGLDYVINALGLRGPLPSTTPTPRGRRVVFVGDSFTFGEGVREDDTLPQQTARLLNDRGSAPVECINGGVGGFDTRQALALFRDRLADLRPDVIVVVLGLNDRSPTTLNQLMTWRDDRFERISSVYACAKAAVAAVLNPEPPYDVSQYVHCIAAIEAQARELSAQQRLLVAVYPFVDARLTDAHMAKVCADIAATMKQRGVDALNLQPALAAAAQANRSAGHSDATANARLVVHSRQDLHPNARAHAAAAKEIAAAIEDGLRTPAIAVTSTDSKRRVYIAPHTGSLERPIRQR